MNKIFVIGFHKTGTKSLASALKKLGYRVTGPNGIEDPDIADNVYSMAYTLVEQYDAFQDNPWPIIYKEIDKRYPESKFILTLRDSKTWIRSVVKHFGVEETPMRKWIYGVGAAKGNEEIYIEVFEKHNREVIDYFKERPDDLLILNLSKGDGWEKLCSFLEKDLPNEPFPYTNKAKGRDRARVLMLIKKLIPFLKST